MDDQRNTSIRHSRQEGIVSQAQLDSVSLTMVGAGGIGSWSALALTKMGCKHLYVIDFDTIEEANLGSQLYTIGDIGRTKVEALIEYTRLFTDTPIDGMITRIANIFLPTIQNDSTNMDIIISAVDSMEVRKDMFTRLILYRDLCLEENRRKTYFIDGRMAGNEINLYCIDLDDAEAVAFYKTMLFDDREARNIPCSERAVVYNTFMVGGLIADHVAHIARGEVPPKEIIVDLFNYTMMT